MMGSEAAFLVRKRLSGMGVIARHGYDVGNVRERVLHYVDLGAIGSGHQIWGQNVRWRSVSDHPALVQENYAREMHRS